jgi:hypothetical protein
MKTDISRHDPKVVTFQKSLSLGIILLRIKGQKVEVKLKLIKELFQNYRNKLLNNFVIITDKKLRFIPLEDER